MANLVGRRVNNYEIKSLLGEGGMGSVYVAEHPVIGRKVAVKVLHDGLAHDRMLVARFMNEARAANAIRHPNIVEIIDAGTFADGAPYLVMELLEGESLAARIQRAKRIRVGDAVEFTFQAASALKAAHAVGIVHRDLKPDNLFLTPDPTMPGRERVRVLDFGIAKLHGDLSGGSVRTRTGTLMGTPPYMSPEQCRGITSEIDERTDIYALGIILFEMLCGTPPFAAEGFGEVMMMHLSMPPPPPRVLNPGIPEHIERTILRALAKTREERFASMDEFQTALSQGPARTISVPDPAAAGPHPHADPRARENQTPTAPDTPAERVRPTTTFTSTAGVMEAQFRSARTRGLVRVAGIGLGIAAVLVVGLLFATSSPRTREPAELRSSASASPRPSEASASAAAAPRAPAPPPVVAIPPVAATAPAPPDSAAGGEISREPADRAGGAPSASTTGKKRRRPEGSRAPAESTSAPVALPQPLAPAVAQPVEPAAPPAPKPQPAPKPTVKSVEF